MRNVSSLDINFQKKKLWGWFLLLLEIIVEVCGSQSTITRATLSPRATHTLHSRRPSLNECLSLHSMSAQVAYCCGCGTLWFGLCIPQTPMPRRTVHDDNRTAFLERCVFVLSLYSTKRVLKDYQYARCCMLESVTDLGTETKTKVWLNNNKNSWVRTYVGRKILHECTDDELNEFKCTIWSNCLNTQPTAKLTNSLATTFAIQTNSRNLQFQNHDIQ